MIRVGIGGWTYEPWRGAFYPERHAKARELEYASRHVTAIEINGTFYSTQKPATWADWAKRTPDDFVFSVKASRFCTNRRVLAEAEESIARFVNQGLAELGPKLGPILWQFAATKKFDPQDFGAFLKLLPSAVGGIPLRHAIEPLGRDVVRERLAQAREVEPQRIELDAQVVELQLRRVNVIDSGFAQRTRQRFMLERDDIAATLGVDQVELTTIGELVLVPERRGVDPVRDHKAIANLLFRRNAADGFGSTISALDVTHWFKSSPRRGCSPSDAVSAASRPSDQAGG